MRRVFGTGHDVRQHDLDGSPVGSGRAGFSGDPALDGRQVRPPAGEYLRKSPECGSRSIGYGSNDHRGQTSGEIGPGLLTLHMARKGNKGRHFVLFRITPNRDERTIDVLRLLHDTMDISRYLPATEDQMGEP